MANSAGNIRSWQKYSFPLSTWVFGGGGAGNIFAGAAAAGDLIAHWTWESGGQFHLDQAGNNDWNVQAGEAPTAGSDRIEGSNALYSSLDGVGGDYLAYRLAALDSDFPGKTGNSNRGTFTWTWWMKLGYEIWYDSGPGDYRLDNLFGSSWGIYWNDQDDRGENGSWVCTGPAGLSFYAPTTNGRFKYDRWYHFALVFEANSAETQTDWWWRVYDANYHKARTNSGVLGSGTPLASNMDQMNLNLTSWQFGAETIRLATRLDEFTIWSLALSQQDCIDICNGVYVY
jgi:hypothetical protein